MTAEQPNVRELSPTPIGSGAIEHLRFIRSTIEAANTFTTVPGKGCTAMGLTALAAVGLEAMPFFAQRWLAVWIGAAIVACFFALLFMEAKAKSQGLSLRRSVARRFFMTLAPAFFAGAVLTAALHEHVSREVVSGLWLLLYGTGIAACGLFSIPVVGVAGVGFMLLGTIALWLPNGYALPVLALGFGGIHLGLGALITRNHGG